MPPRQPPGSASARPALPALSLLGLHGAVLLFGLAGLFARWVPLHPLLLVFARSAVASLAFSLVWAGAWLARCAGLAVPALGLRQPARPAAAAGDTCRGAGGAFGSRAGMLAGVLACGALLALHWAAFFQAVQASTLAVALLAYATAPAFAALAEPWLFRERLAPQTLGAVAACTVGVLLLVPHWDWGQAQARGAAWGVLAGLTFAGLSLLNRALVRRLTPLALAFGQDSVAALLLAPLLPWVWQRPSPRQALLLIALGVFCTALAHTGYVAALRHVAARTAALVSALEPVYGIAWALLLLGERPDWRACAGGAMILAAVAGVTWQARSGGAPEPGPG